MTSIFAKTGMLLCLFLTACSGGSDNRNATVATSDAGTLHVVVETAAGSDRFVQFQLAGVTLEGLAGAATDNLLPSTRMLTVGDPTGEPVSLSLPATPPGEYAALRLVLVPGSGYAIAPDGTQQTVVGPIQVRIPIAGGLRHGLTSPKWLVVGHDAEPLTEAQGITTWEPVMSGRLDGANVRLTELMFPVVSGASVTATATAFDNASVELEASPACTYTNESGQSYATGAGFLQALSIDDELVCEGDLYRDGRVLMTSIRRSQGSDQPRLIGTVLSLDPATDSFEMEVLATRRRGVQINLAVPETARIRAENAFFENELGAATTFASLQVGNFVKVKWLTRDTTGAIPTYLAREVELLGNSNSQLHPEWEGRVQSVDLANQVIVIVPRNNDPILIQGVAVPQAEVLVSSTTPIERRGNNGENNSSITLSQVQPLTDRIWVRGTVSGPALIEATRVRVRQD